MSAYNEQHKNNPAISGEIKGVTFTSHLRGHEIYTEDGKTWFYSDNNEPTANNPRKCGFCGGPDREDGHDACLGHLPGVMNACCGHGIEDEAYIQYDNEKVIRGEEAVKVQSLLIQTAQINRIKELEGLLDVSNTMLELAYNRIQHDRGGYAYRFCEDCERMIKKITETLAKEDSI